ncbi:pentatricopeptide repeat-containing protein At1g11290, chloroplastic-like [Selaginella moellendorffii]|uniref:pentatricopeptide repeat-containing protein At1g11290, chloroplastic-like n=1 Tax=Selaginella moellendorffii TaxID=88036 RepID=UPI000D1C5EBB|nr:pentatricopeptide repeat-containing protein At1g11290, chloroplastic-like [Selaginella moellendorffii]|eukprot:XP_024537237.1 pentatricopeptide repeat-containing protein At1g11290, chloroplastic-like [Selaginella moellendorffii]
MRADGAAKHCIDCCSRRRKNRSSSTWRTLDRVSISETSSRVTDISSRGAIDQAFVWILLDGLKACIASKNLDAGKRIHADSVESGAFFSGAHVPNAILGMYSRCGSLPDARAVFETIASPGLASWTALMSGYANNDQGEEALGIFARMEEQGLEADAKAYVAALIACGSLAAKETPQMVAGERSFSVKLGSLERGMDLHSRAMKSGCYSDKFVAGTLVDMYCKCGSLHDARRVFDQMVARDVVVWNSLILGYAENGEEELALEVFCRMDCPSPRTFLAAVIACGNLAAREESKVVDGKLVKVRSLEKGLLVHSQAERSSGGVDIFIASGLVGMYSKCGSMMNAGLVFEKIVRKDLVLWNSLILGYIDNWEFDLALKSFERMQAEGCAPNCRTFVAALMAYGGLAAREDHGSEPRKQALKAELLRKVEAIHAQAARSGCEFDVFVASTLVDSYAKCGSLEKSREVFERMPLHDLVTWNSLIMGHADNGEGVLALEWFQRMRSQGCVPDSRAFLGALKGCIDIAANSKEAEVEVDENKFVKPGCLDKAMAVHSQAIEFGCESDIFVASALADLYVKCGSLLDARVVFDRIPSHNAVLWTTLLMGYAEKDEPELALELYWRMEPESRAANTRIFVAGLTASSGLAAIEIGRKIHAEACQNGGEKDQFVANSLLDMYCKCGSLAAAEHVFDSMSSRNVVTWSTIIAGYSREGETELVFELFQAMIDGGIGLNGITCLSVLSACGHAGLVDRGTKFFGEMSSKFGVAPSLEHYHCLIDLLGRANRVEEALELASSMPTRASSLTWKTVLGGCWKWKNVKVAEVAFEKLLEFDDKQASAYILMANIYRSVGMEKEELRVVRMGKNECNGIDFS